MMCHLLACCTVPQVYYADSLKFFLSLYGHKLPVLCMDISSDSTLLATGSSDKNIKVRAGCGCVCVGGGPESRLGCIVAGGEHAPAWARRGRACHQ